jgi:hypothetical protein
VNIIKNKLTISLTSVIILMFFIPCSFDYILSTHYQQLSLGYISTIPYHMKTTHMMLSHTRAKTISDI